MNNNLLASFAIGTAIFAASALPANALHKKIRVPIVSSVEVHDQPSQTETYRTILYTDYHLGLTSPSRLMRTDTTEYGYYKKVEIIFHMTHVVNGDFFSGKQQIKGTRSSTYYPSLNKYYADWAVDGPTDYYYGSYTIDDMKVITMEDTPGMGSSSPNFPGGSVTDEDINDW